VSEFRVRQEEDAIAARPVAMTAALSVIIGSAGVFFAGFLLTTATGALRPDVGGKTGKRAGGRTISQVEQAPIEVWRPGIDLRDRQRRELESWGWVDRDAGIAKIPIDRAIDLVVSGSVR
jgi:hypothetical protein